MPPKEEIIHICGLKYRLVHKVCKDGKGIGLWGAVQIQRRQTGFEPEREDEPRKAVGSPDSRVYARPGL